MTSKRKTVTRSAQTTIALRCSLQEAEDLLELARFYEKSMGASRFFVRLVSGSETRARFKFVAQESDILHAFMQATLADMRAAGEPTHDVVFTLRALVAFWGRAISSLESQRSRRKLSPKKLEARRALELRLREAVRSLHTQSPKMVDDELATRREREITWMQERLAGSG
jgi:hypothetical protein